MNLTSLQTTDLIAGAGATHPRVTISDIEDSIAEEYVGNAAKTVELLNGITLRDDHPLRLLTVVVLVLKNGFTVLGKSAPASPENFNEEKGALFAREDAVRQLWPLMGFELRARLHAESEYATEAAKHTTVDHFTEVPADMPDETPRYGDET